MSGTPWAGAGRRIYLNDVGPRDGLQMERCFVPTEDKVALVDALSACGLAKIEVTAFVSPAAIPVLRDAGDVMAGIRRVAGVTYAALVPNVKGAERALEAGCDELNLVMSATETHNLANLRMLREQSLRALADVIALAAGAGKPANVSLSCAFGCPMEGEVPAGEVLRWAGRYIDELGVTRMTLCDTTGMAHPAQVHELVSMVRARWPQVEWTLHFHNTRGMGLSNILAAIDAGADRFDASVGGLGGCPYAPGASGNVCTEDVAHALDSMGYETGIDLERLLKVAGHLATLVGHELPSQVLKAGPRLKRHPPPASLEEIRRKALERG